ncbi:unnamed protein product [Closterium sp. NIES-53]
MAQSWLLLLLFSAFWLVAFISSWCQAQPIQASQALFLEDCQQAWGRTFHLWLKGGECSSAEGLVCDDSGMIVRL